MNNKNRSVNKVTLRLSDDRRRFIICCSLDTENFLLHVTSDNIMMKMMILSLIPTDSLLMSFNHSMVGISEVLDAALKAMSLFLPTVRVRKCASNHIETYYRTNIDGTYFRVDIAYCMVTERSDEIQIRWPNIF